MSTHFFPFGLIRQIQETGIVDRLFRKYSFEVVDEEEEAAAAAESEENAMGVEFLVAPFAYALASLAVSAIFFLEFFRGKRNNFVNRAV